MRIGLYETLILLENLGYTCIPIKGLKDTFFKEEEPPKELPPLPEPPQPTEPVYKTLSEAKKAAKKGEESVYDRTLGGYVNVS